MESLNSSRRRIPTGEDATPLKKVGLYLNCVSVIARGQLYEEILPTYDDGDDSSNVMITTQAKTSD